MRIGKILIAMWVVTLGVACSKSSDEALLLKDAHDRSKNSSVLSLSYGSDVFFTKTQSSENIITPVSKPSFAGHFVAIPAGLAIDRNTGVINLENSLQGQAFKIFYVNEEGKLKDSVRIVISGIDYMDGIYNIRGLNTNFGQIAQPLYNTRQNLPASLANDIDDEEAATIITGGKLRVNKFSGVVDLKSSVENGVLGWRLFNGARNNVTVRYRLADRSARRLNKLNLQLFYYRTQADVPAELLNIMAKRKAIMDRVNSMPVSTQKLTSDPLDNLNGPTEDELDEFGLTVRPPLVIIVGS
ncbi:MAG: hypothetical protein MUE99_08825 [Chitinophagaceae bacterium]|jgi:hypothetical protein|nr:hypothetical protein [Chitinophagaceae bacterium]